MQFRISVGGLCALFVVCATGWLVGCSRPTSSPGEGPGTSGVLSPGIIQVKGSDTVVNLGQAWAEAFSQRTGTQVAVTGGGSGTGIAALINGTCDIAESSRKMEPDEYELAKKNGVDPREFTVALDGIAVVVHPSNPVEKLTLEQLSDIFTGKIRSWKELGGFDSQIVILSREVNSGTHVYLKEHVLCRGNKECDAEFAESALLMPSSQSIAEEVAQNPKAIGYYGMGYISPKQKSVAVAESSEGPFAKPTIEDVVSGKYSISRPLLFYTNGEASGAVKQYIDFVLSEEGQKIVSEQDFVPAPPGKPSEAS